MYHVFGTSNLSLKKSMTDLLCAQIVIKGIVTKKDDLMTLLIKQADLMNLKGWIRGTDNEMEIEIEGERQYIEKFYKDFILSQPALVKATEKLIRYKPKTGYKTFKVKGDEREEVSILPPDHGICNNCLKELFDTKSRRYKFPFINCKRCGPRFSLLRNVPLKRENLSFCDFKMCKLCKLEYYDPLNLRFQNEVISCFECGPKIELYKNASKIVKVVDFIKETIKYIKRGETVAIKDLCGFYLICDMANPKALNNLRKHKKCKHKPFAVIFLDLDTAKKYCSLTSYDESVLLSPARPIVVIRKKNRLHLLNLLSPNNNYLGVMLPSTPLQYLLLNYGKDMGIEGFAFTSGNLSDELIEIDNKSAFEKLSNFAKVFLLNDVKIENRCDDSVILSLKDKHILIRRGRGYIPSPILLSQNLKPILATGAGLKNVFCLTKKNLAFMSQQIESLENSENYSFFKENIQRFKLLLKIEPEIIAYDLNPQYPSTKYALEESQRLGIEIIGIQHHHAHIAGTIAEHGLNEPVIGVVMDGTGFGHDGAFWGGEILIVRPDTFERFGHLKYHPMPGDTKASYEPYRMALSYVYEALGKQLFYKDLNFKDRFGDGLEFLVAMIEKDINSPLTSSCKEFFNAVSSLIGVCDYEEYKNQAFCELERLAETQSSEKYHYELTKEGNKYIVNTSIIIEEILKDIEKNVPSFVISTRFHNTVVSFILELVYLASKRYQIKKVAISGEVFQNRIIFEKVYNGLLEQDLLVYYNQSVPLNDGGIALGQAYIAHFKTKG